MNSGIKRRRGRSDERMSLNALLLLLQQCEPVASMGVHVCADQADQVRPPSTAGWNGIGEVFGLFQAG